MYEFIICEKFINIRMLIIRLIFQRQVDHTFTMSPTYEEVLLPLCPSTTPPSTPPLVRLSQEVSSTAPDSYSTMYSQDNPVSCALRSRYEDGK